VSRMTKIEPSDSVEYSLKSEDEFPDVRDFFQSHQTNLNSHLYRFNLKIQNGCQSLNEWVLSFFF
jgi:hypothetical protein